MRLITSTTVLLALIGFALGATVYCSEKGGCSTVSGTSLKCSGVDTSGKTLFLRAFLGSDGRYYGYQQFAITNLFIDDEDDANGGLGPIITLPSKPPTHTILRVAANERLDEAVTARNARSRPQIIEHFRPYSFPGFSGPICEVVQKRVVFFGKPFGLCCKACRH